MIHGREDENTNPFYKCINIVQYLGMWPMKEGMGALTHSMLVLGCFLSKKLRLVDVFSHVFQRPSWHWARVIAQFPYEYLNSYLLRIEFLTIVTGYF